MATASNRRAPARGTRTEPRPNLRPVPAAGAASTQREQERDWYLMYLRATTNRRGQPYSERTVGAYEDAVISLDKHLSAVGFAGSFTDLSPDVLNPFRCVPSRAWSGRHRDQAGQPAPVLSVPRRGVRHDRPVQQSDTQPVCADRRAAASARR